MSAENIYQTGYLSQSPVLKRSAPLELSSDFSLPDYQPEIRRLLSTRVSVLPPSLYLGNDSAEFSGEIIYHILYSGNDGSLYSASLTDSYSFSVPVEFSSKNVAPDDLLPLVYLRPDSVVSRVLGPRKLNFRSKLGSSVELLSPALFYPRSNSSSVGEDIQNLISVSPSRKLKKLTSEPISVSEFITMDSPTESARIVDHSARVFITECSPLQEKLSCKGEILLKILYCNDSESDLPLSLVKKIPFSCLIEDTELEPSFDCRATAYASDEKLDIEENGINCELSVTVCAEAQKNEQFSYIKDSYSTERSCECNYQSISVPLSLKCSNGNVTQSEAVRLSEAKISPDAKLIDLNGTATVRELTLENGKIVTKGECVYSVVFHHNEEFGAQDVSLPFKYEIDCRGAINSDVPPQWTAEASIISSRGRSDGESLFIDSEIAVSLRASNTETVEALAEISFGEELASKRSEFVICYPDKNDTLWSVAKRYAVSPDTVKQKNAISENDQTFKKKYLLI